MTTRRLLLIRHAKTEPGDVDETRKLTERGRRDAAEIGRWISKREDLQPELVVVSPATRARQTWELAAGELPAAPRVVVDPRIYANTERDLLAVMSEVDPDVQTLVLVGHNPSIESLARAWATEGGGFDGECATASVAAFTVADSWARLDDPGVVVLTDFVTCRG